MIEHIIESLEKMLDRFCGDATLEDHDMSDYERPEGAVEAIELG